MKKEGIEDRRERKKPTDHQLKRSRNLRREMAANDELVWWPINDEAYLPESKIIGRQL
jgi:hypothetical protein